MKRVVYYSGLNLLAFLSFSTICRSSSKRSRSDLSSGCWRSKETQHANNTHKASVRQHTRSKRQTQAIRTIAFAFAHLESVKVLHLLGLLFLRRTTKFFDGRERSLLRVHDRLEAIVINLSLQFFTLSKILLRHTIQHQHQSLPISRRCTQITNLFFVGVKLCHVLVCDRLHGCESWLVRSVLVQIRLQTRGWFLRELAAQLLHLQHFLQRILRLKHDVRGLCHQRILRIIAAASRRLGIPRDDVLDRAHGRLEALAQPHLVSIDREVHDVHGAVGRQERLAALLALLHVVLLHINIPLERTVRQGQRDRMVPADNLRHA